ncbi:type I restriction enzyme S subunit [Algoriphagus sp. 4150]|uniref:restriction endonuclease subunit S n=1 Tax=Algoriphagus sp. 4150 TaxID=2817756 RepID=UPI00285705ED|nr:restriction endonuclease subunit S [Algoriphagus sp. 4150]MDR7131656.1 type I restriction enzyme S subunit [Algoriphagus sp. 4150]
MEFVEYTIGELALEVKTGKTPPTSNPEYFDGEIPWIGPSDLKGQKLAEDSERKISKIALEDNKAFLFQSETVLISTIGDIGKTAIVKKPVASNQQLTGILVNEDIILPELFYYWVRLNKRILENKANTSVLSMLNNKLLKRVKAVFPKYIEDQYKIIGRLNRIQELIDKRVDTNQLLDKYIRSVFLEMFLEKSTKWEYISLKESNGVKNRIQGIGKKSNSSGKGKPMLRMNNLTYSGETDLNDLKWIELSEKEEKTFYLENRNVLFNRTNSPELVGKIAVWNHGTEYTFAGYLVKIELDETILNPYYLTSFFNSDFGKMVLRNKARLSGNLANISGSKFLEQLILLPPIELQVKYEKTYLKFQEIRFQLENQQEFLQILFQAYLQDSFKNEEIDEDEVFETLLQKFNKEDLKQGNRLKYLLKWIDCKEPQFSKFESYDIAWDRLRELLEDGSIEQVMDKNEIKLKVVE